MFKKKKKSQNRKEKLHLVKKKPAVAVGKSSEWIYGHRNVASGYCDVKHVIHCAHS